MKIKSNLKEKDFHCIIEVIVLTRTSVERVTCANNPNFHEIFDQIFRNIDSCVLNTIRYCIVFFSKSMSLLIQNSAMDICENKYASNEK